MCRQSAPLHPPDQRQGARGRPRFGGRIPRQHPRPRPARGLRDDLPRIGHAPGGGRCLPCDPRRSGEASGGLAPPRCPPSSAAPRGDAASGRCPSGGDRRPAPWRARRRTPPAGGDTAGPGPGPLRHPRTCPRTNPSEACRLGGRPPLQNALGGVGPGRVGAAAPGRTRGAAGPIGWLVPRRAAP